VGEKSLGAQREIFGSTHRAKKADTNQVTVRADDLVLQRLSSAANGALEWLFAVFILCEHGGIAIYQEDDAVLCCPWHTL
jgi:hypothetical protein